jgi:hypothetical protein
MKRALRIIAGLVVSIVAALAVFILMTQAGRIIWSSSMTALFAPPAPALLEHVSGASGWFGGCPPLSKQEAAERTAEALSPELNQKLAAQFPPGSSADSLIRTLTAQGFKLTGSCQNDSTIHRAGFRGPTRGSIFETQAEIYWKTEGDTLVWIKGFVMFSGL